MSSPVITENSIELVHAYDPLLFVTSVVIASFGGYVALWLINRAWERAGSGRGLRWLAAASGAMGIGIWSMHFTGMLALRLPVPAGYGPGLTLLSGGIAVLVSLLALTVVRRERVTKRQLAGASAVMGGAIAGMHYTGMAAMRLPGEMFYRPALVVASLVVGVLASGAALWLFLRHRDRGEEEFTSLHRGKLVGGLLLGLAISGLHYTGMAAARFRDLRPGAPLPADGLLLTEELGLWVGMGSLLLLGLGLVAALLDRRLQRAYADELRESRRRYETLLTEIRDVVTVLGENGVIRYESPSVKKVFGYEPDELVGRSAFDLVHPEDVNRMEAQFVELLSTGEKTTQYRLRHADGSWRLVESTGVKPADGEFETLAVTRDITDRVAAQQKYRAIFETTPSAVGISSLEDGRFIEVNPAFGELLGYRRDRVIGSTSGELGVWADPEQRERVIDRIRERGTIHSQEVQFRDAGGEIIDVLFSGSILEFGKDPHFLGIAKDIRDRKEFEEALEHRALHDQLTGLPNRTLFHDRLVHALERADRAGERAAVLFLDLDGFKAVNDARGHAAGDRVLRMLADRLQGTLRDGDTVARFGGDEFAVLLEGVSTFGDIEQAVSRVRGVFEAPFEVQDAAFPLTVSIGVAHSGIDVDEPEELVRLADVAMYRAKRSERTDVQVFDPDQDRELTTRH